MYDQQTYESIEQFLAGELKGAALTAFEERMEKDPDLSAEVALQRDLAVVVSDERTMDFSAMVADVVAEGNAETVEETPPAKKRGPPRWLALAASVILIALVGFFALRGGGGTEPTALFDAYFGPYEAPMEFRSDGSPLEETYQKAYEAYGMGRYAFAIADFEKILVEDPADPSARFYLGVSHLGLGDGAAAEKELRTLIATNSPVWMSQATWYLALALLEQGKGDAAEVELEKVALRGGTYGRLAKEVLRKL